MKVLKKYSELLQKIRPNAARLLLFASDRLKLVFSSFDKIAEDIVSILVDFSVKFPGAGTWLYYFSNGGFLAHVPIERLLRSTPNEIKMLGIICDSCPAYPTPTTVTKAVGNGRFNLGLYPFFGSATWLLGKTGSVDKWWRSCKALSFRVPELYLYSQADSLTLAKQVEDMMEARAESGVQVTSHKFENSAHCMHLKMYPEAYKAALEDFMKEISP